MRSTLARTLDSPRAPVYAGVLSLVLGLLFAFVRAPHPWGWQGIDQYHELAQAMARGEPFGTTDVPWGYAYFVAAFYTLFGPHAWIPVLAQVVANAAVPVLLYRLVLPMANRRTAAAAALLVGVFSFNTIYASTLASDAICTVLFLASLLAFARGHQSGRRRDFIISGLLFGIVPQFRPNLILLPALIALAYFVAEARTWRKAARMATFLLFVAVALSPWILRNYSLTGRLLPTSTHGGIQLWYGTLQVGPYLESRADNPRSVFEPASFDYTSLAGDSLVVQARRGSCASADTRVEIVYWTDRDDTQRRLPMAATRNDELVGELPGQLARTTVYYALEVVGPPRDAERPVPRTPIDGDVNPLVYFISSEHLADLDRHDDLLDVFDLVRLMRYLAWRSGTPLPKLDLTRDGAIDLNDLRAAVLTLLGDGAKPDLVAGPGVLRWEVDTVVLNLADGSRLAVRRIDSGRVTDLEVHGALGRALIISRRPWTPHPITLPDGLQTCELVSNVRVNEIFYRREVHEMGRYLALAFDNIGREPGAFLAASLYRIGRLFVLRGSDDTQTAHQFGGSRAIYGAGQVLSVGYLLLFFAGAAIAVRRRSQLRVLLVPIAYVPLTICFVLTNMRYTITVQPLMFAFVAMALVTAFRLEAGAGESSLSR